jgi:hypothetical protein
MKISNARSMTTFMIAITFVVVVYGQNRTAAPIGQNRTAAPIGQNRTAAPIGQNRTAAPIGQNRTAAPIGQNRTAAPIGQNRTAAPTNTPTFKPVTLKCDFNCTEKIFCGKPNATVPKPYLKNCACDKDIYGKPICWQNMHCKKLFQRPCTKANKCKPGFKCVPLAGTCCEKYYKGPLKKPNFCVRKCFTPGFPYSPMPGQPCPFPSALGLC